MPRLQVSQPTSTAIHRNDCHRISERYPSISSALKAVLMNVVSAIILVLTLSGAPQTVAAQQASGQPLQLGQQYSVHSQTLAEQRLLNVWLPASYSAQMDHRYPVLYLLDGGMDEDFLHIVGLVKFLNAYQLMPETIVVGIVNVDRKRDFTSPSENAQDQTELPQHGGSARFIEFVENELLPWAEQNFRLSGERTLLGQSLGGLLATQILLYKPQLFQNYLIVSPSLWWNDQKLFHAATNLLHEQSFAGRNIYFAVGNEHPAIVTPTRNLEQTIGQQNWPDLRSRFEFLGDENHATILHQAAYRGFIWFYKSTLDAGTKH